MYIKCLIAAVDFHMMAHKISIDGNGASFFSTEQQIMRPQRIKLLKKVS